LHNFVDLIVWFTSSARAYMRDNKWATTQSTSLQHRLVLTLRARARACAAGTEEQIGVMRGGIAIRSRRAGAELMRAERLHIGEPQAPQPRAVANAQADSQVAFFAKSDDKTTWALRRPQATVAFDCDRGHYPYAPQIKPPQVESIYA